MLSRAKPPLPHSQTRILIARAQAGDRLALETLAEHNLRLVIKIAGDFCRRSGRDFDDAVSDGLWGLTRAINNFDLSRGTTFSTFAWRYIENSMKWKARPVEQSMDQIVKGTEGLTFGDTIPDPEPGPEHLAMKLDLRKQVDEALAALTDRERDVVSRAYGLDGEEADTAQIASELGIGRSRVTELHRSALRKLKRQEIAYAA